MKSIFFFDLDNTLADARKRYLNAGAEPPRLDNEESYRKWLGDVQSDDTLIKDKPLQELVAKVALLADGGYDVAILTAREEKFRGVSEFWLQRHGLGNVPLLMRPNGNRQEAHDFKKVVLNAQLGKTPQATVTMVDDDPSGKLSTVCHELGVRFFKVYFNSKGQVRCGLLEEAA